LTATVAGFDPQAPTAAMWQRRIRADRDLASRLVPDSLRPLHTAVVCRAHQAGAHSLILSGSTARGCRTEISDLDYHLVGDKILTRDLSAELDLHVLSPKKLMARILEGDDFIQWSIRFGLLLFDDNTVLDAARLIVEERAWPDVERKAQHARKSLDLARRVVETGDSEGALIQVRTALALSARAHLLSTRQFPLSRAELPTQLVAGGHPESAAALEACIHGEPSLEALGQAVSKGYALLERFGAVPPAPVLTTPSTAPWPSAGAHRHRLPLRTKTSNWLSSRATTLEPEVRQCRADAATC
jgi:hypothetical protein